MYKSAARLFGIYASTFNIRVRIAYKHYLVILGCERVTRRARIHEKVKKNFFFAILYNVKKQKAKKTISNNNNNK